MALKAYACCTNWYIIFSALTTGLPEALAGAQFSSIAATSSAAVPGWNIHGKSPSSNSRKQYRSDSASTLDFVAGMTSFFLPLGHAVADDGSV
jgi:hypothetical protein